MGPDHVNRSRSVAIDPTPQTRRKLKLPRLFCQLVIASCNRLLVTASKLEVPLTGKFLMVMDDHWGSTGNYR
ncbi:unnamed protein product [Nezara viridula]|uniref:Uncharacterized protein n=1 Tax=Nezara viridula TaxID=85310 RepID=A0A9P0HS88_NEZVI|nr:unnamed protein product [Nezara viridula]